MSGTLQKQVEEWNAKSLSFTQAEVNSFRWCSALNRQTSNLACSRLPLSKACQRIEDPCKWGDLLVSRGTDHDNFQNIQNWGSNTYLNFPLLSEGSASCEVPVTQNWLSHTPSSQGLSGLSGWFRFNTVILNARVHRKLGIISEHNKGIKVSKGGDNSSIH